MAKNARAANGRVKKTGKAPAAGSNAPTEAEVREYLHDLHNLHDGMEESNGKYRSEIKGIYERAAENLGITKKSLQVVFRKERRDIKDQKWAKKADTHDRDALLKLSTSLTGTPLGDFAQRLAEGIPLDQATT